MERAIYLACQHDFDEPLNWDISHAQTGYVPAFLSTWRGLQEHGRDAALIKLCCHHQVSSTDIELLSTPAQSVERLRIWKKHHCEDAAILIRKHAVMAEWMRRNCKSCAPLKRSCSSLHSDPSGGVATENDSTAEARGLAAREVAAAEALADEALLRSCQAMLEAIPFAVCDRPHEAEMRWLDWCQAAGLSPGSPGAISRLRKIMYDELWGRLVDGQEGWLSLANMAGRDWQAEYAAAQRCRLQEAVLDFASSLRSARFLESAIRQAFCPEQGSADCSICLQPLRLPRITPCAHIFCAACIERSLALKTECPKCRSSVCGPSQLSELQDTNPRELFGDRIISSSGSSCIQYDGTALAPSGEEQGEVAHVNEDFFGAKISALVNKLETIQCQGEKAVVFAQWQDLILKIHAALAKFGVPAAVLAGGAFERASVLQRFESPSLPVLLLSLEDSASGTNMSHACHVLFVHPMVASSAEEQWAFEAQAIGRVRRWGQKQRVQVWRFVMEDTIEEDLAVQHGSQVSIQS